MNANTAPALAGHDDLVIEEFGQQVCANPLTPALPCWSTAQVQVSAADSALAA